MAARRRDRVRAPAGRAGAPVPRVRMSGEERRQQLLDVARSLFAEKGFDGASVEEIAHRANVSKPVVYEHFGGKEGVYAVVVDREMHYLLTSMTIGARRGGPPAAAAGTGGGVAAGLRGGLGRRLPDPGARVPGRLGDGDVLVAAERHRAPGGVHPGAAVQRAGLRPEAGGAVQPGAGGHGGADGPVVAGLEAPEEGGGGGPPGEPLAGTACTTWKASPSSAKPTP